MIPQLLWIMLFLKIEVALNIEKFCWIEIVYAIFDDKFFQVLLKEDCNFFQRTFFIVLFFQ